MHSRCDAKIGEQRCFMILSRRRTKRRLPNVKNAIVHAVATHNDVAKKLMSQTGVQVEVEFIERDEGVLLDALLKARQQSGLTQADVAARMGTQAPAFARMERSLATGTTLALDCNHPEMPERARQKIGATRGVR